MPDDKSKSGAIGIGADGHTLPDHDRVTADQTYEIEALMAKHKKSQKQVLAAIEKAGPSRVQIERALRK